MELLQRNSESKERKNIVCDNTNNDHYDKVHKKVTTNNFKIIALVFLSLLLDLLAFTMILPLLPSLLEYYHREEGDKNGLYTSLLQAVKYFQELTGAPDRFVSVLFGGALGSMYSFLQFLTSPIVGSLSDAYGRKPMLLICLVGIAISHVLWFFATTFSVFVLARFIGGLSKANVSLCMTIVTDASNEKTRARGMALIGLAFSLGFMFGPLAGAWFAMGNRQGWAALGEAPASCAICFSWANIFLVMFLVPETLPKDRRAPLSLTLSKAVDYVSPLHLLQFTAVKNISQHQKKVLSELGLIYFLYLFLYSGLEFTLTFLTHHTFNYTAMQQGKMFLAIGLIMALLQGGAARRLSAAGAEKAARAALALTPLSFVCVAASALPSSSSFSLGLSPTDWLWSGLVLFAISTAFAVSCLTSMAGGCAVGGARGAALGTLRSLGALARALGPLFASTLYWCYGATFTYTVGSFILILPAVMLFSLKT